MTRTFLLAAVLAPAVLGAIGAPQPPPGQVPAGDVENGGRLYAQHACYFCHGTVGQGGVAGARIAAVARNTQSFIRYVRRPSGQMPAFADTILSDRQLTDIFAYLRSLPPAKAVKDIPLLEQLHDQSPGKPPRP